MGKKSRNKRRDDKNVKSKANSETHKKAETTKNDDQRLMIEIQISRPQFPQQILECKTQNNSGILLLHIFIESKSILP